MRSIKWCTLYPPRSHGQASASARLIKRVFACRSRTRTPIAKTISLGWLNLGHLAEVFAMHAYECFISNMEISADIFCD